MARQKTILFACGTGVATSTAVNVAVTEAMKARGLTFNAMQCKATEVASMADNVDLIVSTTPISASVQGQGAGRYRGRAAEVETAAATAAVTAG
jgi:galactitol PTS system EIIB component